MRLLNSKYLPAVLEGTELDMASARVGLMWSVSRKRSALQCQSIAGIESAIECTALCKTDRRHVDVVR